MKKIILISGAALVGLVLIAFLIAFFKFTSHIDRFVNLQPGDESRIVLVNIGEGDRAYIASKIDEINACNPAVIGIDIFFKTYSDSSEMDRHLLSSIQNAPSILGTRHKGVITQGVHMNFLRAAQDYGYAELNEERGYIATFNLYYDTRGKRDFHFAYSIINYLDSALAQAFLENQKDQVVDIVLTKLQDQFTVFDFNEAIDCESVEGKIVLMGPLGPGLEDKKWTYARSGENTEKHQPDMYGPVIIANQLLMMLDSN